MQLSTNYIKKIQKYIENPIIGLSLYVFIFIYNLYGLIILENKKNKPTKIHPTARVHPSACISLYGVQIGKNVIIGKKAVIKFDTHIQPGVIINDNCVIGDTGYQIYRYKTKRLQVIHTGGVIISENAVIGSNTCIDRGLFGKFTYIGSRSKIGEHAHIGHNIHIGSDSTIEDNVTIGGNTFTGERVYIRNNSVISNRLKISSNSVVKQGTIVTRDILENVA